MCVCSPGPSRPSTTTGAVRRMPRNQWCETALLSIGTVDVPSECVRLPAAPFVHIPRYLLRGVSSHDGARERLIYCNRSEAPRGASSRGGGEGRKGIDRHTAAWQGAEEPPVLHTGRARIKGEGRRQAGDAGWKFAPCMSTFLVPAPRRYRGDISATTAARLVPEITVDHHRGAGAAAPPGRARPSLARRSPMESVSHRSSSTSLGAVCCPARAN